MNSERMLFSYIDESRASQEVFAPLYLELYTDYFKGLSNDAKTLYTFLRHRMALSLKNKENWTDEATSYVYVIFTIEEAMTLLNIGKNKTVALFKELEEWNMIDRRFAGQGNPTRIFVRDIFHELSATETGIPYDEDHQKYNQEDQMSSTVEENDDFNGESFIDIFGKSRNETFRGLKNKPQKVQILDFQRFENQTSRSLKNKPLEVYKSNPSNNNIVNILSNNISNSSHSFNSKQDHKNSGDLGIEELNERMKSRKNNNLLSDQFSFTKDEYHLSEEEFKKVYEDLYYGNKFTDPTRHELVELFAKDLIQYDNFSDWDKKTYAKSLLDLIVEVLSSANDVIKIGKDSEVSRREFIKKILVLDHATIDQLLRDLKKRLEIDSVKYPKNYLLKALLDANLNQGSAIQLKYSGYS